MSEKNGIPTIDLGDFMSDDCERRKSFVQTFGQGLLDYGFIKLEGHGIEPSLIREGYDAFESFFAFDDATAIGSPRIVMSRPSRLAKAP